jgi:hypothetical protein
VQQREVKFMGRPFQPIGGTSGATGIRIFFSYFALKSWLT